MIEIDPREEKPANRWFSLAYVATWFLLVADGLLAYLQHVTLKKKIIPSTALVLFLFLGALLFREKRLGPRIEIRITYALICSMLITLLIGSNITFGSFPSIIFGFYVNYWYFFLAAYLISAKQFIPEKIFINTLFILAAPVVLLGVAQGIKQDNFAIGTWIAQEAGSINLGFFGKRRANSVFAHAADYGIFCGTIISIAAAHLLASKKNSTRALCLITIFAAGLGVYFTFTRTAYLVCALSLLSSIWISLQIKKQNTTAAVQNIPWLYLVIALLIYFAAPMATLLSSDDTLLSSDTLKERMFGNSFYIHELLRQGWYTLFTGLGWYVNGYYIASTPIDNQYIGLLLSTGAAGLVLWFALTYHIWKTLVLRATKTQSATIIGLTGMASTWLAHSVFDVTNTMAFIAIICLVLSPEKKSVQPERSNRDESVTDMNLKPNAN